MLNTTLPSNNSLDFTSIPRFCDTPIKKIPKYVFENCNQITCNSYDSSHLESLKSRARSVTKQEYTTWLQSHPSKDAAVVQGEEFDWIYGLETLEKDLLPLGQQLLTALTTNAVIRYNGIFSRLGNINPGQFRTQPIRWGKYDMEEINEGIVFNGLETQIVKQYGPEQSQVVLRNISALGPKKKLLFKRSHIENIIIQTLKLKDHLQYKCEAVEMKYKRDWHLINPQIVQKWIQQQGRTDDKLDISEWLRERVHYFPLPATIKEELQTCLKQIKEPDMHPIEKASRIWYDIVRIHISHEANKRTGKAIASAILLAFGYLPPKIGKEDEKEYIDTLKNGFEDEQGLRKFTEFVGKMILKTHLELASKLSADNAETK